MKTLLLRAYAELVASHNRFSHTGNSDPSCLSCKLRDEIGEELAKMLTDSVKVTITNRINVSPEAPRPATPVRECVYKGGIDPVYESTSWDSDMTADLMVEKGKKVIDDRTRPTLNLQPVLPLSDKADILTLAVFHRGIDIRVYRLHAGCEWSLDVKASGLLDFVRAMPQSSMWSASRAATEARTIIDKELDA